MSLQWRCGYICLRGFRKGFGFQKRRPYDRLPCDEGKLGKEFASECISGNGIGEVSRRFCTRSTTPRSFPEHVMIYPRRGLKEDGEDDARKLETAAARPSTRSEWAEPPARQTVRAHSLTDVSCQIHEKLSHYD